MDIKSDGSSFNQYGSVAIASGTKATEDYTFQLYMTKNGTVKLFGADTGISVAHDFTAEISYDGTKMYGHFIGKDTNGNDKETGANNSWYFTRTIENITALSCALPVGVNIKTLTITANYDDSGWATPPTSLTPGDPYVTGNGQVIKMHARDYITNTDSEGNTKYDKVPEGKAWQMVMDVIHKQGQTASYNKWGSCILSSEEDPINTYYWNNFQVYEHSGSEGSKRGTLNFKSNKGDGNDHVIAQGHKVYQNDNDGYEDYRVIVRYDGNQTYLIRTIILDAEGNPTDQVFNNVWFAARVQHDIDVMSCALPEGTNLKSLAISIAEDSNLMEDVNYAIQNTHTSEYLSCDYQRGPEDHFRTADHASKFQIEFTNNNDLAFHDGDGGLHPTLYILSEVWNEETEQAEWKYLGLDNKPVDSKADAVPYLYSSNSKMIEPINNTGTGSNVTSSKGTAWAISDYNQWDFVFFGNYLVVVTDSNKSVGEKEFGGVTYKSTQYRNNQYVELPTSAKQNQIPNTSEVGYSASIVMDGTMLRVSYNPLKDMFYNITDLDLFGSGTNLYYWYKEQNTLVTYSTASAECGNTVVWNDEENGTNYFGDCTKYSIAEATEIAATLSKNKNDDARDAYHYGTLYSPVAYILPEGVDAYIVKRIPDAGSTTMLLRPFKESGEIVPAKTGVVLYKEDGSDVDPIAETIKLQANCTEEAPEENVLTGLFITGVNPKDGTYYTLGRTKGMGFYRYTGAKLTAFKAFYHSATGGSASYVFDFDHEPPTGLEQLDAVQDTHAAYDLQGRRLTQPKGLFISNGRIILSK